MIRRAWDALTAVLSWRVRTSEVRTQIHHRNLQVAGQAAEMRVRRNRIEEAYLYDLLHGKEGKPK